ncbi:MAG: hypothetical protein ACRDRI_25160 [Pseudonocardiaceae bacterium]
MGVVAADAILRPVCVTESSDCAKGVHECLVGKPKLSVASASLSGFVVVMVKQGRYIEGDEIAGISLAGGVTGSERRR